MEQEALLVVNINSLRALLKSGVQGDVEIPADIIIPEEDPDPGLDIPNDLKGRRNLLRAIMIVGKIKTQLEELLSNDDEYA